MPSGAWSAVDSPMKLNHLHLTVDDVPATRSFLERYFGLRPSGEGHKNFDMLLDDDGLVLTLIGAGRSNTVSYPKTFHIGFIQPSEEAPGGFRIVVRSEVDLQADEATGSHRHRRSLHGKAQR